MNKYPKLYIWKEKHGDRYCQVNNKYAEGAMLLTVLENRYKEGYYPEEVIKSIEDCLKRQEEYMASVILKVRKRHEYEDFSIEYPEIYE